MEGTLEVDVVQTPCNKQGHLNKQTFARVEHDLTLSQVLVKPSFRVGELRRAPLPVWDIGGQANINMNRDLKFLFILAATSSFLSLPLHFFCLSISSPCRL